MKKISTFVAGMFFSSAVFAGGFGAITPVRLSDAPIKIEEVKSEPVVINKNRRSTRSSRYSLCGWRTTSRWYECDTKSVLLERRFHIRGERISGDLTPTVRNRATRGHDLEREFDRQAAARNKLLRWRRAFRR